MATHKWGSREIMAFLAGYKKYPCLWDFNHPDYKNRSRRCVVLEEFALDLNIGIDLLKSKIHSIRNTYINEINKIRKTNKSSVVTDEDILQSKLSWFSFADSFLRSVIQKKRMLPTNSDFDETKHNETNRSLDDFEDPYSIIKTEVDDESEDDRNESAVLNLRRSSDLSSHAQIGWESLEPAVVVPSKRLKLANDYCLYQRASAVQRRPPASLAQRGQEDEFDTFSKSVAAQLKKLSEECAAEAMAEIQGVLTLKRLQSIRNRRQQTSSERSTSPRASSSFAFTSV